MRSLPSQATGISGRSAGGPRTKCDPLIYDPAVRLLFACLRPAVDLESARTIDGLLHRALDWPALLTFAARHRVRPMLYARLSVMPDRVPAHILAELAAFNLANTRRCLMLVGDLFKLLDAFHAEEIPVAPFKGPILAASIYGSPGLREAGDLDLLVHRDDIVRARQLLETLGHQPIFPTATPAESRFLNSLGGQHLSDYLRSHSEHHMLREQGALNVDLHWALAVQDFHLPIDQGRLWSWLAPQHWAGRPIQTFTPEALLLVLCINGAKDCWERLDRVCDIAALLRGRPLLNWETIFEQARSVGIARIVRLGLLLAADLLRAPLPDEAARHIRHDPVAGLLAKQVRRQLFLPVLGTAPETASARRSFLHLRQRERLRDRVGYVLAHLRPNVGDWAAMPLPPALGSLHYATRPFRLAWRYLIAGRNMADM